MKPSVKWFLAGFGIGYAGMLALLISILREAGEHDRRYV